MRQLTQWKAEEIPHKFKILVQLLTYKEIREVRILSIRIRTKYSIDYNMYLWLLGPISNAMLSSDSSVKQIGSWKQHQS